MTEFEKRKETIYGFICDELYVPMKVKEMAVLLQIPKSEREELQQVLDALVADGKIEMSVKGKYSKSQHKFVTGVFEATANGYGFVRVADQEEDIFIPEKKVHGAIHMDQVQVSVHPSAGPRREGEITKVLSHGLKQIVGTYEANENFGFVRPDNPKIAFDIFVPAERSRGAVNGHKVVVELTSYGNQAGDKHREDRGRSPKKPEGKVVEILGHINDPGTDIISVVRAYELPTEFPERVLNQVERVAKPVSAADMAGRMDLRDWQTVTIDGEDAKDLDDAITICRADEGYKLGVHIADVTNYVQEHSALDVEALKRGTSVYLVDRVIPMLPHGLSNGICSLNQGEDRLALSCIMTVDKKGAVTDHCIAETVIRVDRRMSYTDVNAIITKKDEGTISEYKDFVDMFFLMKELADILRGQRKKRGSIDFDFPESKIVLDDSGRPFSVAAYERNAAHKIIEDFMLLANETVAEDYYWQEIPFVYRTHEKPDPDRMRKLASFINNFGFNMHLGRGEVHPMEVQKLLAKIEDTPQEAMISRLALRSMKRARYSTECVGHFGLAAKYYCHFTSPIRRYPDLQIHRIIKENLRGRMNDDRRAHYGKILPEVAQQTSELERRADEAERDVEKMKKAEYMQAFIGEIFTGVISHMTKYGMYVELPNTVEGMVRVADMDEDYFDYVEADFQMVGARTGKTYKLGQQVQVQVASVNKLLKTIDFYLITG